MRAQHAADHPELALDGGGGGVLREGGVRKRERGRHRTQQTHGSHSGQLPVTRRSSIPPILAACAAGRGGRRACAARRRAPARRCRRRAGGPRVARRSASTGPAAGVRRRPACAWAACRGWRSIGRPASGWARCDDIAASRVWRGSTSRWRCRRAVGRAASRSSCVRGRARPPACSSTPRHGIARAAADGAFAITNEGHIDRRACRISRGAAHRRRDGGVTGVVQPRAALRIDAADRSRGVRHNLGLESLTLTPDGRLISGLEQPLAQDGPVVESRRGGRRAAGRVRAARRPVGARAANGPTTSTRRRARPGYDALCEDGENGL